MSLTPKAVIAQVPFGNLLLEGFQTKILVRYPIAIGFKDGWYSYRWVGENAPDFICDGYCTSDDRIISVGENGIFHVADLARPVPQLSEYLTYLDPVAITSSSWLLGLTKIVGAFEYDSEWYDLVEKFFSDESTGLQRLFLESTFWATPQRTRLDPIGESNVATTNLRKTRKPRSTSGFMYAIQLDGFIKVGFSSNVQSRMSSYKTSSRVVDLICTEPASIKQELAFHKKYNNGSEKYDITLRDSIHNSIKSHLKLV